MTVQGLAPYLVPPQTARWWGASGTLKKRELRIRLREDAAPFEVEGICGLAAPCSLPRAFLQFLGDDRPERLTAARLLQKARAFAARRPPGQKHPRRAPAESRSALARDRLLLHHAALPLLKKTPTLPSAPPRPPFLFEVDVASLLSALDLPATDLAGAHPHSVDARSRVLQALQEGVLGGVQVTVQPRDHAVASLPALEATLAAAAAAWVGTTDLPAAAPDLEAWIPLP